MAILIPDIPKECTHTERHIFRRFERELPDDTIVLHSLRLSGHSYKVWGEADFVVISPKGLFVLEVKGGRVECVDGKWTITSPDGTQSYTKSEGPFDQACSAMAAVRKELSPYPLLQNILVGYGVVMPHEQFLGRGTEILQPVLLDRREFDRSLESYIERLSRYWCADLESKYHNRPRLLRKEDIVSIRRILRPDVQSHFSIGSYLTNVNNELIELTAQQRRYVRGMQNNARTIIEGHAGTGKTVLAVDRARDLARNGKHVLFLCFNRLLAKHIEASVEEAPERKNIVVSSLHAFYRQKIAEAGLEKKLNLQIEEKELFGRVFPEVFLEAVCTTELEQFDVIVVDEAQDLLTIPNLEALDAMLKGGIEKGCWHFFMDPLQDIYGAAAEQAMEWLQDIGFASYQLTENCRNTKQIAATTTIVSGLDVSAEAAISGPPVEEMFYADSQELLAFLDERLSRLLAEGVSPADIVILSARRLENSELHARTMISGLSLTSIEQELASNRGIHFATMHSFKGLERKVVFALSLEDLGKQDYGTLHYVGLSRARTLLILCLPKVAKDAYASLAIQFANRLTR